MGLSSLKCMSRANGRVDLSASISVSCSCSRRFRHSSWVVLLPFNDRSLRCSPINYVYFIRGFSWEGRALRDCPSSLQCTYCVPEVKASTLQLPSLQARANEFCFDPLLCHSGPLSKLSSRVASPLTLTVSRREWQKSFPTIFFSPRNFNCCSRSLRFCGRNND